MDEPVTTQEPVVNVDDPGAVEPVVEKVEEPIVEEPQIQYMTPEQVAETVSRETNQLKTWLGRRDKDLLNQVGNIIDERLSKKMETPEELSSKLLEDPVNTIREIMTETQNQQTTKTQQHSTDTLTHLGTMMDSDPLYQDKDLGNELVDEVKKQFQTGKVDESLSPQAAAKVVHAEALANVLRARKKANPLKANQPGSSTGTIMPGTSSVKTTPKMPDLSEDTKKWAKKWGYSDKDLIRIYGKS